jgi:hypothetical protein
MGDRPWATEPGAWDTWTERHRQRGINGNGHGKSLAIEAQRLLPPPTSRDGKGPNQRGDDTCLHGALLPTPRATDGTKGGPNQRGSSGDLMLPSAVTQLLPTPTVSDTNGPGTHGDGGADLRTTVAHLLPTPAVNDMGAAYTPETWDQWTATMQAKHGNGNGNGKSLAIEAQRLLPTPQAHDAAGAKRPEQVAAMRAQGHGVANLNEVIPHLFGGASTNPPSDGGKQSPDD